VLKKFAVFAVFLSLMISATAQAAEAEGTLEGQLVNSTANGSSVSGHDVLLIIYESGVESSTNTTTTDSEGRFVFDSLDTAPEYSYEISLLYQEAQYYSDILTFSGNETTKSLDIKVWDSTDDKGVISIVTAHTIIYTNPNSLQVTEYYLFTNDSDRTYIGSEIPDGAGARKTLSFTLPVGVTDFQALMGLLESNIFGSEEGFIDTLAMVPGMREVSFQYGVVTESGDFTIPQQLSFPIVSYDLIVQGGDVGVEVSQLAAEPQMDIEGTLYSHLTGSNLPAGEVLRIELSGLPQPSAAADENTLLWVIFALILVGGASGLFYAMKKKGVKTVSSEADAPTQQDELLASLAELDNTFENGDITEESYRKQRDSTKAQLLKLMKKADAGKDNG